MNLSGHWKGIILYGPEYGEWEGKELFFEMTIKQTDDTFKAIAIDTGGIGCNPDEADIEGFISEDSISFTKQYRSTLTYDEKGQVAVLKNKPSAIVDYTGVFNSQFDKVSGEWQIDVLIKQLKDEWLDETFTGHWTMTRNK
jgi:hypothetical protein